MASVVANQAAPPADETDRLIEALEPITERYRDTQERREGLVLFRAVVLAPTLGICESLLRGERVPVSRLDRHWARRYRLR